MRGNVRKLLSIGLLAGLFIAAIVASSTTQAQQSGGSGNGFRISPVRYEVFMNRGDQQVYKLIVENPTNVPIEAQVLVNDFSSGDKENGEPKIYYDAATSAEGNSFKSIASAPESVTISANSKVTLDVTLKTTSGTSPGGYYGVVRVVPKNQDQQNVSLAASVGTIFLVRVEGQLTEKLDLVQFTAAKNGSNGRFFINSGKMTVVTRLKNNGNIHVKPYGRVDVTDRSGKSVETYEFNSTEPAANILPNSTRKFEDTLKNQKWFGKYTVTANLGYGTGGSLITAKTTFWVIPAWMVIVAGVLFVALLVAGFLVYRKFATKSHRPVRPRR
jgi:hypothetical protein